MNQEQKNLLHLMNKAKKTVLRGGACHYLLVNKGATLITYSNNLVAIERDIIAHKYVYISGQKVYLKSFR